MHLARVIGTVHASIKDPPLEGAKLLIVQPVDGRRRPLGRTLVAVDTVGAGFGEIVFYTTAYEAVIPWKDKTPGMRFALVDAAIVGIADRVDLAEHRP